MKTNFTNITLLLVLGLGSTAVSAGSNFTIYPKVGTTLPTTVNSGSSVSAYYTITNNTYTSRVGYQIVGLPNTVTQNTASGNCSSPVTLGPRASCTLQLDINGAVSANFALCKGNNCTEAAAPLNVVLASLNPPFLVGGQYQEAAGFAPLIARSADFGATWSYTLTGNSLVYPPALVPQHTHLIPAPVLQASSCSGNTCVMVGNSNSTAPLAATSTDGGLTWRYSITATTPAAPAGFVTGYLMDVYCSRTLCVASGQYNNGSSDYPLVVASNDSGLTWSYVMNANTPSLPASYVTSNGMRGVNCNGTQCIAVGQYSTSGGNGPLIAVSGNGFSWTYSMYLGAPGTTLPSDYLNNGNFIKGNHAGVNFLAAGNYQNLDSGSGMTFYYPWIALSQDNGLTWSFPLSSSTASTITDYADNGMFNALSCSGGLCVAAGSYTNSSSGTMPLAAVSTNGGISWTYKISGNSPALPSDYPVTGTGGFYAAHCSGSTCIVAGNYTVGANSFPLLANSQNNGATWSYSVYRNVPNYPTSVGDSLVSGDFTTVTCVSKNCIAAGSYNNGTTTYPLLAISTNGGVTWTYKINSLYPALPTGYVGAGGFYASSTGISNLLPASLKNLK